MLFAFLHLFACLTGGREETEGTTSRTKRSDDRLMTQNIKNSPLISFLVSSCLQDMRRQDKERGGERRGKLNKCSINDCETACCTTILLSEYDNAYFPVSEILSEF